MDHIIYEEVEKIIISGGEDSNSSTSISIQMTHR